VNTLVLKLAIGAAIAAGCVFGWWRLTSHYDSRGYQRAQAEAREAMQAQAERNRELQRAAERNYTVQAGVRERVIVETIVEVRHAAQSLASCPVPDRARSLLNDAAKCARDDSAASCGAGEPVPVAR
jgi:hypothetical protein